MEKAPKARIGDLDKKKYLVPSDLTGTGLGAGAGKADTGGRGLAPDRAVAEVEGLPIPYLSRGCKTEPGDRKGQETKLTANILLGYILKTKL